MKLLKKLSITLLAAAVTFVAVAQTPTIFNLIRVNTGADIRGLIENQTGIVTVDDDFEVTGDAEIGGTLTVDSIAVSSGALTRVDDTNVTLTLGGSPSTALLNPTSLTLGWTGQLAVGRGGTGASTLTGLLLGNGTSAFTAISATDDSIPVGNGTTYQVKTLPDCDDTGGNHLNYDTATNAFACGNTGGGGGGGSPGGSDTQVQYNNAGGLGGDAGMTYNNVTDSLTLAGTVAGADVTASDDVIATDLVQGADVTSTDDLSVGDDAVITDDLSVSGIDLTPSQGTVNIEMVEGCTTTPNFVVDWVKIGPMVVLYAAGAGFTCTSDSTSFSSTGGTGLPADLRPTASSFYTSLQAGGGWQDNGSIVQGCIQINNTTGVVTFGEVGSGVCSTTNWQSTGTKAVPSGWSITYHVANP
jgi:hypothetical protein